MRTEETALNGTEIRGWPSGDVEFPRGSQWTGPSGHVLTFTNDGNLELFNSTGKLIWESRTSRLDPHRLVLKANGDLALCDWRSYPVWSTRTAAHPGAYLVLQRDGNLVLYSADGSALWQTDTAGR